MSWTEAADLHLGIIEFPVPVLKGSGEEIRSIRDRLYLPEFRELTTVDFSRLCTGDVKNYEEFTEKMACMDERELEYLGIAICGPKKKVNKLTGGNAAFAVKGEENSACVQADMKLTKNQ